MALRALRHSYLVFFSSRRRHTRCLSDWSSDVCSSDLTSTVASEKVLIVWDIERSFLEKRGTPTDAMPLWRSRMVSATPTNRSVASSRLRARSEERRVGKECRSRRSPYHEEKKYQHTST